ncbi:MAG: cupin domain-containing protein [Candidatus Aquirickettsiella sp.]
MNVECKSPPGSSETLTNVLPSLTVLSNPNKSQYPWRISFQIETQNVNRKADRLVLSYVDRSVVMVNFTAKDKNAAHSMRNIKRGDGIQVVTAEGTPVFDDELREGQSLIVPQNFAVVKRAANSGFEWVAFKKSGEH